MSTLGETYALACGLKIGKPELSTKFYPLPFDKYIVVHNSSGMQSKNYSYWQEVVDLIHPIFTELGYHFVQIGDDKDKRIKGCFDLCGKTDLNQTFYILENCDLIIGNDSFSLHCGGILDKKLVGLYSIINLNNVKPDWGNPENQRLIQAPLFGQKPSYSAEEHPKVIDRIKPEEIVCAISDLMKVELPTNKTIHIGDRYTTPIVECTPEEVVSKDFFPQCVLNIRADYTSDNVDSNLIAQNLSQRTCAIVTDKAINLQPILPFKQNLKVVMVKIKDDSLVRFVSQVRKSGVNCILICENLNEDELNNLKLHYMDYGAIQQLPKHHFKQPVMTAMKYKSGKVIISNGGKMYLGNAARLVNIPSENLEGQILPNFNFEEFERDEEHFYIFC